MISFLLKSFLLSALPILSSLKAAQAGRLAYQENLSQCPLSASITGPVTTGLYSYPLDIYNASLLESLVDSGHRDKIFNCTSIELYEQRPDTDIIGLGLFHNCSTVRTCPIHKQNLYDALKRSKAWSSAQYFCPIKSLISHNVSEARRRRVMNVIILGGSVTAGQFTTGYYCLHKYDRKCKPQMDFPYQTKWGDYLKLWFEKGLRERHVKVHVLPIHGYSSSMMNEVILDKLEAVGLRKLRSSDLVLIDHSYNDGLYLAKVRVASLAHGLESLIRKLSSIGRPRIVIMETLAYLPTWLPYWEDYQQIYTKIAKHYSLPVWSIRDAVTSAYCAINQPYCGYLRHDKSLQYDLHPSWHLHLFYADMVAKLLQVYTEKAVLGRVCANIKANNNKNTLKGKKYDIASPENSSVSRVGLPTPSSDRHSPLPLPPPLEGKDDFRTCERGQPALLDISASGVLSGGKDRLVGSWTASPDGAWMPRSESRNRAGFIHERSTDLAATSVPVSASASASVPATLYFHLDDPQRSMGSDGKKPHLIQVQYLRTYQNAGQVRMFVCGNLVFGEGSIQGTGNLDALWSSYDTYNYSLPEMEYVVFPDFGFKCNDPNDLAIRFEYIDNLKCRKGVTDSQCQREKIFRDRQKFKIISLKVCPLAARQPAVIGTSKDSASSSDVEISPIKIGAGFESMLIL